jgi:hypothetical protein
MPFMLKDVTVTQFLPTCALVHTYIQRTQILIGVIVIWHVVVSNICILIHHPCVRSCSLLKPKTTPP